MYIEWNSIRLVGPIDGIVTKTVHKTVTDPEFPRGGGANPPGFFPKNCMKLKEFGAGGRGAFKILLCRSATAKLSQ